LRFSELNTCPSIILREKVVFNRHMGQLDMTGLKTAFHIWDHTDDLKLEQSHSTARDEEKRRAKLTVNRDKCVRRKN